MEPGPGSPCEGSILRGAVNLTRIVCVKWSASQGTRAASKSRINLTAPSWV